MRYCSEPTRQQLWIRPRWASDLRRKPRSAYDSAGGVSDPDLQGIVAWARQNLSDEERAVLTRALGGARAQDEPDHTVNRRADLEATRDRLRSQGPRQPGVDAGPPVTRVDAVATILSWLRRRESLSDQDITTVQRMLEGSAGAQNSARARYFAELRRDGVDARQARIVADSLARICDKPATPSASRAAQDAAAFAKRYPKASRIAEDSGFGAQASSSSRTPSAKQSEGFDSRFPAARRIG